MEIKREWITPAMAKEYLQHNTANYRSLNKYRVLSYSEDMKNGKWQFNGEAITFGKDGRLLNGQHRLHAIVKAGVPVEMLVIFGLDDGVNIYDIGGGRSTAQIAKARGAIRGSYTTVMSVASYVVNKGDSHYYAGKATVLQYAEDHVEDILQAIRYCMVGCNHPICKKAPIMGAVYCMIRNGEPQGKITDFFRTVNSGIPAGDCNPTPALILRNMVQEYIGNSLEIRKLLFSATVQALRDYMAGKTRQQRYKLSDDALSLMRLIRDQDGL